MLHIFCLGLYIGVASDGTTPDGTQLGNKKSGVYFAAVGADNEVGGPAVDDGNKISNHAQYSIDDRGENIRKWKNNTGENNLLGGGRVQGGTLLAENNTFTNNGGPGIIVVSGTGHTFTENTITGNAVGIRVESGSDNLALSNTITSNSGGDIHLPEGSTADTFQISQNTLDWLLVEDGSVEVVGLSPVTLVTLSGGNITGASVLEVLESMSWTAGSLTGSGRTDITSAAILTMSTSQTLALQRLLRNYGSAAWTGSGRIAIDEGAAFVNQSSGTFDGQGTGTFGSDDDTGDFTNLGTYTQSGFMSNPSFTGLLTFANTGSVQVIPSARLSLQGTYEQMAGSTFLDTGATLAVTGAVNYTGGSFDMDDATLVATDGFYVGSAVTFDGTGTIEGDVVTEGTWILGDIYFAPASLSVVGNFTQDDGTLDILSGTFEVSGDFRLNSGTLYLSSSTLLSVGGDFDQAGGEVTVIGPGSPQTSVAVGGSFTQSDGSFTLFMGALLDVGESVTLSGGLLRLNDLAYLAAGTGVYIQSGGRLTASGYITGNVFNYGILDVGGSSNTSTLSIAGNYTQTGTFNARLDEYGSYDQLSVSGLATLSGTFALSLLPNTFPTGPSYSVLSYGSRSGTFDTCNLPALGEYSGTWDPRYDDPANTFTLWIVY